MTEASLRHDQLRYVHKLLRRLQGRHRIWMNSELILHISNSVKICTMFRSTLLGDGENTILNEKWCRDADAHGVSRWRHDIQEGISVDCQPIACHQHWLHGEQVLTRPKWGGGGGVCAGQGPCLGTSWTELQTHTTKNIAFATPSVGDDKST